MAEIGLVDVSFRDGNQSLWGATGIRTRHVLEIAPVMNRVGFRALDFTSSTHMGVAVRTHREDPWERIRRTREAMPDTPLQFIGTGFRFISWERAHPAFMRLVYERLVANGMSRFIVLDPMHDMDAVRDTARMLRAVGAEEIVGALVYTVSDVHDDAYYADLAGQMRGCGDIHRVYVKDPSGLLTPERARTLFPALLERLGDTPLELHSHTSLGLSARSSLVAADLGVGAIHVGCGPLGNGTSLPEARRLVANLRELGHDVPVDDRLLEHVAGYFHRLADAESQPKGAPRDFDAAFLRHQVAGGVMTTLRRQLREIGHEDRFDDVIDEVVRVRAELGSPIMVTPFPQIVCSQALYNVIGDERYGNVSDQAIRYVLGTFGRPPAPIDPEVKRRILNRPRAEQLRDEDQPAHPDELRGRFPADISDEEFLLRATMPAEEVDPMVAAGPAPARYTPELQPVLALLDGLRSRPPIAALTVDRPGFRLTLRRRGPERAAVGSGSVTPHTDGGLVAGDDGWAAVLGRIRAAPAFVFDMDGTLVLGDRRNNALRPLPGALELAEWLADRGTPYLVVTNGTTRTPARYAAILRGIGFNRVEEVITPASSAATVCRRRGHRRAVVIGGDGLSAPLRDVGVETLDPVGEPDADAVVVGWAPDFGMPTLEAAVHAVWGGARLYSCSQSLFFATADGRQLGTSRAISSAIAGVTGAEVEVVGKPAPYALEAAAERAGAAPEELVVVGDDPDLEIVMARAVGAVAVAVDSGVGTPDAYVERPPEGVPDLHVRDVEELLRALKGDGPSS